MDSYNYPGGPGSPNWGNCPQVKPPYPRGLYGG